MSLRSFSNVERKHKRKGKQEEKSLYRNRDVIFSVNIFLLFFSFSILSSVYYVRISPYGGQNVNNILTVFYLSFYFTLTPRRSRNFKRILLINFYQLSIMYAVFNIIVMCNISSFT